MRPAFFDTPEYKKKQAEIVRLNWRKGIYNFIVKRERRNCLNRSCKNSFTVPPSDKQRYCSKSCWYLIKQEYRLKFCPSCLSCEKIISQKGASKFCSLRCQATNNYKEYISRWKQGLEDGNKGIKTRIISRHLRRYLQEKYKDKCSLCGWNTKHTVTGVVPLEVDHIDGNAENNKEENLRLICPNCHSLTPSFRNLNKGKGRGWRLTYLKIHSQTLSTS